MATQKGSLLASRVVQELISSLWLPVPGTNINDKSGPALNREDRETLAASELWQVDLSWSKEAPLLRELAVTSPSKMTPALAKETITHLRVVDKQVTELDAPMLQYKNLEELVLTGNYLQHINTDHLPPNLKVLELCYNQLGTLRELDRKPLQLQHLGLGLNRLSHLQFTPLYWLSLVSLDLSHNLLCDLSATVRSLAQLTSLRSLMLMGNPIALVPCYQGYTVDTLGGLLYLDDRDVTPMDRQQAAGMSKHCNRHPDLIRFADVDVQVESITGLPELQDKPLTSNDTDEQITRTVLQVTHTFLPATCLTKLQNSDETNSSVMSKYHLLAGANGMSGVHPTEAGYTTYYFKPVIYSSENINLSDVRTSYQVHDLEELKKLFEQGINVEVQVNVVTFTRDEEQDKRTDDKKHEKGAKTTASKKPEKVAPKGKMKAHPTAEFPAEGWNPSSVNSVLLGSFPLNVSRILKNRYSFIVEGTATVDTVAFRDQGLLPPLETVQESEVASEIQSNESQLTTVAIKFVVRQWSSVSDLLNSLDL